MNGKLKILFTVFAWISSAIFIFSSIYIALFWGIRTTIELTYIWGVLFVALIATLARIPFLTDNEISKKKMLIYNILYFAFINILVLAVGYRLGWFYLNKIKMLCGIEITIIIVYVCVMFIIYRLEYRTAEEMNRKLKSRINSNKN